jgi:MSHA biogenesis protein MshE
MRDEETAQIGLRAALTGHLVLSTLHTKDAISSTTRLIDMGAPHYMVASSVHAVLAQRLVRKNCESCKRETPLTDQEERWLVTEYGDARPNTRYWRGTGCTHCNGTGFLGRVGVYEMLELNAEMVRALNVNDINRFTEIARRQIEGNTLKSHGLELAERGITTVAEAVRVASESEE